MRGKPSPRSCYVVMAGRDPPSSRIIRYPFERELNRRPRNAPGSHYGVSDKIDFTQALLKEYN